MPRPDPAPGSAADWLARARGDLALAQVSLPAGAFLEDLCYHAQQAAEKAVKAVYQCRNTRFEYTHDLGELLAGLVGFGVDVPADVLKGAELTVYSWAARYPSTFEPVTDEEYEEAVRLASTVVKWADNMVSRS